MFIIYIYNYTDIHVIKALRLFSRQIIFLHEVGSDGSLDDLPTDRTLGEGGRALRTGNKMAAGQKHDGDFLVQTNLTDCQVFQFFILLLQHIRIS